MQARNAPPTGSNTKPGAGSVLAGNLKRSSGPPTSNTVKLKLLYSRNVETDRWDGRDHFAKLQLVEDRCFSPGGHTICLLLLDICIVSWMLRDWLAAAFLCDVLRIVLSRSSPRSLRPCCTAVSLDCEVQVLHDHHHHHHHLTSLDVRRCADDGNFVPSTWTPTHVCSSVSPCLYWISLVCHGLRASWPHPRHSLRRPLSLSLSSCFA